MTPGIYKYHRVDVFTNRPFCGNPLAVFTDAQGLDTDSMQRISRELNLSETSFVFPAEPGSRPPKAPSPRREPSNNKQYRVRVFTPTAEVRTGGAPTLGTVFALAREAKLRDAGRVVLQGQSGPVSVTMVSPMTTTRQPVPEFGDNYADIDAAAALLGLTRRDLLLPSPVQSVHCGIAYTLIPVRDLPSLANIQFRRDIWNRTIAKTSAPVVVAFTPDVKAPYAARTRVFAPGLGVSEDPATPAAAGAAAAYMVRHGIVSTASEVDLIVHQGVEIGRPSEIHVALKAKERRVTSLRIGGECVWMGQGEIHLLAPPAL